MSEERTLPRLRLAIAATGVLFVTVALLADWLGLDSSATFGTGEVLLLSFGIVLVLVAVLWKRTPDAYKATAIILLNTIVLLVAIEFAVIVFSTASQPDPPLPAYYAEQDWSDTYWAENDAAGPKRYEPYVVWRRKPFEGKTITIDPAGIRKTSGDCHEPHKVFMFGGSTMWGWGAPDWLTIPSYFQAGLTTSTDSIPCVTNFGDDSYITTQSVVGLIRELQAGARPELVIFYDGINDTLNALESGKAGVHTYADETSLSLEKPFSRLLSRSQTVRLVRSLRGGTADEPEVSELEFLADSVVQVYLGNYEIVAALGEHFGFEHYFFWQPAIAVDDKVLTTLERSVKDEMSPRTIEFFRSVYERIERVASQPGYERLYYIGDVFRAESYELWMDPWHVTPEGSEMVARTMLDIVGKDTGAVVDAAPEAE